MIWKSIDTLRKNLDLIDAHLSNAQITEKVIKHASEGGNEDAVSLSRKYSDEKIFRNKAVFISLYGAFEQFIDELLSDFLINQRMYIPKFSELHKRVSSDYVERWKKFHSKLKYPRYKDLKESDIVQNLYDVICNDKNIVLPECFKRNGGNYNYEVIRKTYYSIGIELQQVERYCALPINDEITRYEAVKSYIDDLVERRNSIAHSAADSINLQSIEQMQLYVMVIRRFSESLYYYVQDVLSQEIWERNAHKSVVLKAMRALQNPQVLYFMDVKNADIRIGQPVVVRLPEGNRPNYIHSKIDNISYSVKEGDDTIFAQELDASKEYHDISVHFESPEVIHRNAEVLFVR